MMVTKDQTPDGREPSDESIGRPEVHDAPSVIVGVGASAGGLGALQTLFAHATPGAGLSFVVVQHLSPKQPSNLVELLDSHTSLPVVAATADARVEADTVYIIEPNTLLRIEGGRLKIESPVPARQRYVPINVLFESLAADLGERAVGVVLSGTGSDGTLGLKAIKENSGVTVAQAHPERGKDSQFQSGMPDSAVASGLVDQILPVEEIALWIQCYAEHLQQLHHEVGPESLQREIARNLGNIVELLLAKSERDFRGYKTGTLTRRIQRRLQVRQMTSVPDYLTLLRDDSDESQQLVADFLVGVTRFFRDPEAFDALDREVLAKIAATGREGEVRVWVPGCATGEEAYSVAILLRERLGGLDRPITARVFATDVDGEAIAQARSGRYGDAAVADIEPGRLARFFVRDDGGYRVAQELRDLCVFSTHDLTSDPPFSRIDLICCRNVLIYMQPELQKRLFVMFHYGLKPGGYLWLGPSEAVAAQPPLFGAIDKKYRIFARRDDAPSPLLDLPLPRGQRGWSGGLSARGRQEPEKRRPDIGALARDIVAERYAPAYAVVDEDLNALFLSNGAGRFLEPPTGRVTAKILNMARSGLRLDLRSALHESARSGERVEHAGVRVKAEGGEQRVTVFVEPMNRDQGQSRHYLVVFRDERQGDVDGTDEPGAREGDEAVRLLEAELEETKERLSVTVEELESSYEELQSSNEELLSMNEELQSSNEELGTSKEELQSVNEELETINHELAEKVQELSRSNSDLKNLLNSTQLATVFLDRDLRVRWFNPSATDVFRLRESDHDRPITDLALKIAHDGLEQDARRVLRTLENIEREVASADGAKRYILHVSPYRTVDDIIDGVVVVCVDVTALQRAEAGLEQSQRRILEILEGVDEAFLAVDKTGTVAYSNRKAERLLGQTRAQILGRPIENVLAHWGDTELSNALDLISEGRSSELKTEDTVSGECGRIRFVPSESGTMIFLSEIVPEQEK